MIKLTFMLTLAPWLRRVAAVLVLPVLAARWSGVLPPRSIWSSSRPSLVISSHSQPAIQSCGKGISETSVWEFNIELYVVNLSSELTI